MYDVDRFCRVILKILATRDSLSCSDLSLLTGLNEINIAKKVFYLFSNGFIETNSDINPGDPIGLRVKFSISVKGRSYLEYIVKDNWRFRIPVIISIIAIIISIISLRFSVLR